MKSGWAQFERPDPFVSFEQARLLVRNLDMPTKGTPAQRAETRKAIARMLKLHPEEFKFEYGTHGSTGMPRWVTPVVTHGGFAMRDEPAAKLCDDDRFPSGDEIMRMLKTGMYQIEHPEHGALPAVLALTHGGYVDEAREILKAIEPWTDDIRFFPKATSRPPPPPSEEYAPSSPEKAVIELMILLNHLVSIPQACDETVAKCGERSFHRSGGPRDLRTMLLVLFTDTLTVAEFMLQAAECVKLYDSLASVPYEDHKCVACTGPPRNDAIGDTRLCHGHKDMTLQPCSVCGSTKTVYHREYVKWTTDRVVIEARDPAQLFDELVAVGVGLPHWLNVYLQPYRDGVMSQEEMRETFTSLVRPPGYFDHSDYESPPFTTTVTTKNTVFRDLCSMHAIREGVAQIYNAGKLVNPQCRGTIVRLVPVVKSVLGKIGAKLYGDDKFDLHAFVKAKEEFDLSAFVEAKKEFTLHAFVDAKQAEFVHTTVVNAVKKYGSMPGTPQYKTRFGPIDEAMKRITERIAYISDLIDRLQDSGPSPVGVSSEVMATIVGDLQTSSFHRGKVKMILDRAILKSLGESASSPAILAELCTPMMTTVALGVPQDGEPDFLRVILVRTMQAFMTRRSIMLLDVDGQVRASEVPWIGVLQRVLKIDEHSHASREKGLAWLLGMSINTFPHCMVPNETLRLIRECKPEIPVLEELAVDIFTGRLVPKFGRTCELAAKQLGTDSAYCRYYGGYLSQLWGRKSISSADLVEWAGRGLDAGMYTVRNGMLLERVRVATCFNMLLPLSVLSDDFDWRGAALKTWAFIIRLGITEREPCLLRSDIRKLVQAWNLLLFYVSSSQKVHEDPRMLLTRVVDDMMNYLDDVPAVKVLERSLFFDLFITALECIAGKEAWAEPPVYGWFNAHLPPIPCSVIVALRTVTPRK